jgi:hypothetical protein
MGILTTRQPLTAWCVVTRASVSKGDILKPLDRTTISSLLPLKAQRFGLVGCLMYKSLRLIDCLAGNV